MQANESVRFVSAVAGEAAKRSKRCVKLETDVEKRQHSGGIVCLAGYSKPFGG
jgi:hypothetical protein